MKENKLVALSVDYRILPKKEKAFWLPKLFDILYANMSRIAPEEGSYAQQKVQWLSQVSPALDKDPRQVLMCLEAGEPVGYIQYYTRGTLLMVEEVQIARDYQRTTVFFGLCRRLRKSLPPEIQVIEAYADRRNGASIALMGRLGMLPVEEGSDGKFLHFRGEPPGCRLYKS